MRRLARRPEEGERGATIILVAVLVTALFAVAALVIDVGALQQERRELQNSADSAALWIAQRCAAGDAARCTTDPVSSGATALVDSNSLDGASTVDSITFLPPQRVNVTVSTETSSGQPLLPFSFGQLFGPDGKTVHARATATWAGLRSATVIPLVLSRCEFARATNSGVVFDQPWTIYFHRTSPADSVRCAGIGVSGSDLSGGFGWIKDTDGGADCSVTLSAAGTAAEDTGVPGTPHACNLAPLLNTDVLVPIYDSNSGPRSSEYHIYGFGQYRLTGYFFSSTNKGGTVPCGPPNTCLGGRFVRFVAVGDLGGPSLGNQITLVS